MVEGESMDFWSGKRVLVTGGAGFLGSHLVDRLSEDGVPEVFVPRRDDYDLVDMDAVRRLYRDAQPDIVIHLAARVGGIGANQANPGSFFYDNLMMGAQMMEVGRRAGVEKFLTVGTVCAYPKYTPVPFAEDELWNGYPEETNAAYGLAKKVLLVQAQAYRREYGMNSVYLLPVNLYGPRDNFDLETSHVIPAIIRKMIEARERGGKRVTMWGTGRVSREFLYVTDAARAILLAAELYNGPEPVNIGSGEEITIADLVETIRELTGYRGEIVWDSSRPDGQPRRRLDTVRAREEFGFRAEIGLREGLARTIEWYEVNESPVHQPVLQA
jgi:GDP-L-fucose synthase